MEVRVVDDGDEAVPCGDAGQIIIRPQQPNMIFSGYWKNPEATVAAFQNLWFHTGDYGRFDPDGYLYFVDRRADLIESGDQVISSIELENAIRAHPSVAAVAVHVVACPEGNEIKAVIVPMAGVSLQPAELAAFFKTTFSEAQRPRYAELVDRLPTNASLKVLKHVLRAQGITPNTWDLHTVETEES
jgi:crotonobetaine/carnitine-CoA ligase